MSHVRHPTHPAAGWPDPPKPVVQYITKQDLKELISPPAIAADGDGSLSTIPIPPPRETVILDVRDDDRIGGHIPGSIHVPSSRFLSTVDDLLYDPAVIGAKKVVFHCALSQQRGPMAARIYAQTRLAHLEKAKEKQNADGNSATPAEVLSENQEVLVLRGGFTEWQAVYRSDPHLVEKWDKEVWGR